MLDRVNSAAPLRIRLSTHAAAVIEAEIAAAPAKLETGGILLGRRRGEDIEIVCAGGPGPQAVHQPSFFLRDLEYAQQLADAAWSQHEAQWVGEWHTHPTSGLAPSDFDLSTYRKHLRDAELDFKVFVSIIGRATPSGARLVAWLVDAEAVLRMPLEP